MRKIHLLLTPLAIALTVSIFSSCKDEDEPAEPPQISMSEEEVEVSESEGAIEIKIAINPAATTDMIIYYDLGGTAEEGSDYEIEESGEVEVSAGQTEAVIEIDILNDEAFENDETISIELDEASVESAVITSNDETVVTITSDDQGITASFAESRIVINEADRTVSVPVNIDKAYTSDITLEYEIGGDAIDTISGTIDEIPARYWDYFVVGEAGSVTIPAGETSSTIDLNIYSDFTFDDGDSIVFTLSPSDNVVIGDTESATVVIGQEDGTVILLEWEAPQTDMDLVLWLNDDGEDFPIAAELWKDDVAELIVVPKVIEDVSLATSYVYYSGGTGDLEFTATFIEIDDYQIEPEAEREVFTATYTEANKNVWTESEELTWQIVQRFNQVNGEIENIQPITVPSSGSRSRMEEIPFKFRPKNSNLRRPTKRSKLL